MTPTDVTRRYGRPEGWRDHLRRRLGGHDPREREPWPLWKVAAVTTAAVPFAALGAFGRLLARTFREW